MCWKYFAEMAFFEAESGNLRAGEFIVTLWGDLMRKFKDKKFMIKVFISYSTKDKDFVEKLKVKLQRNNIDVIYSSNHMIFSDRMGMMWYENISKTINSADYALVIISSHSTYKDLFFLGLAEGLKNKNFVIPLKIQSDCEIPPTLLNKEYLDFSDPIQFESTFEQLLKFLGVQQKPITYGRNSIRKNTNISIDDNNLNEIKTDVNLKNIRDAYNNGNLVLFCGAGISYDAGIPTWNKLLEELLEKAISEMNEQQVLNNELADLFQNKIKVSPLILGKYLKMGLENNFTTIVRDILYQDCNKKSKTIDEIVELSRARRNRKTLKAIITFNFDDLIEEKMKSEKIDYKTIFKEGERFEDNEIPIYHPHGFLPRNIKLTKDNEIVFSEDTYHTQFIDPFSWGNLVQLNYLNNNTCLFVGISLTDPNMRRLLDVSMRKNGKNEKNHYIIKKHYTNNDLYSDKKSKTDNENKMLKIIEYIEEKDANALGFNLIWINEFSEIPKILNKIYSPPDTNLRLVTEIKEG